MADGPEKRWANNRAGRICLPIRAGPPQDRAPCCRTMTAIPGIMRTMRWMNGARLLDVWFSRRTAIAPRYSPPDTTTIRMDAWALTFHRAREVYDRMIRERIWSNAPAKVVVARMLRQKGLLTNKEETFGRFADPVPNQDGDYVNERVAGGYTSYDDLTAALGAFVFRVVVAGVVAPVVAPPNLPTGSAGFGFVSRRSGSTFGTRLTSRAARFSVAGATSPRLSSLL
jgi:hypothetical protein